MKNFKKALASIAAGAAVFLSPVAQAGEFEDHYELLVAVEKAGIDVVINDAEICSDPTTSGMYRFVRRKDGTEAQWLHVCQDNRDSSGDVVAFTANDYDTIRHEAWHIIQDCYVGRIGDFELEHFADSPEELIEWAKNHLSSKKILWIIESYEEQGASADVILREIEAFAMAEANIVTDQTKILTKYCMD